MTRPGSIRIFEALSISELVISTVDVVANDRAFPVAGFGSFWTFWIAMALAIVGLTFGVSLARSAACRWLLTILVIIGCAFTVIAPSGMSAVDWLTSAMIVVALFAVWRESATDWVKGRWDTEVA